MAVWVQDSGAGWTTRLVPVLLAVVALLGCEADAPSTAGTALSREEFVELIVELREAERALGSDVPLEELAAEQREILERRGVTAEDLRAFVRANAGDLGTLYSAWHAVNERLVHETTPEEEEYFERPEPDAPPPPDSASGPGTD